MVCSFFVGGMVNGSVSIIVPKKITGKDKKNCVA